MSDYDFVYVTPSYIDEEPFKRYAEAIESVIHSQPDDDEGMPGRITIRGIHEALGVHARPAWTCDALERLSGSIEPVGLLPTRYRRRTGVRVAKQFQFQI